MKLNIEQKITLGLFIALTIIACCGIVGVWMMELPLSSKIIETILLVFIVGLFIYSITSKEGHKEMLAIEEKQLISLIATDLETGRHLLRRKSDWKRVLKTCGEGLKKADYDNMCKELDSAIKHFDWHSDKDKSNQREKEILIQFKSSQDYDFYVGMRNCV